MTQPRVQLFILSRDRVDFCRETVTSALAQSYKNYEIIVSDNSEGNEVEGMLAREFPEVKLIRRNPTLAALSHFNSLIADANSSLMVLFHDDDVLDTEYIERMVMHLEAEPSVLAVGCNAKIIKGCKRTKIPFMGEFEGTKILRNASELLDPYLSISLISPAPFPGYMYRTDSIKGLGLDEAAGGKHADVSFLAKILSRGPVIWTSDCLFYYRFHGNNDSSRESIGARLSWLRYIYTTNQIHPRSRYVRDYKMMYWMRWLNQNSRKRELLGRLHERRKRVARKFVLLWALQMAISRPEFWRRAWRAIWR